MLYRNKKPRLCAQALVVGGKDVIPIGHYRGHHDIELIRTRRNQRRAAVAQSNARLQQASSAAVSTLLKIMVDVSAPASNRVRAADRVLDHAKQAIERDDIEVRVATLERAAHPAPSGKY